MTDVEAAPLVAIVTPVYNGAALLAETMESVQSQTYLHLVHCVLDNGSDDDTSKIITSFKDRRVPLITARNAQTLPLLDNWNAALGLVPHDAAYFRVLSADDCMDRQCIEKMVAVGEKNPQVGVILCQDIVNQSIRGADLPKDRTLFDGRFMVRSALLGAIDFPHAHCLYRYPPGGIPKRFFETEFYGTRLLCADADAVMRMLSESPCGYVHEPLTMTRWPGNETSSQLIPNKVGIWSTLQLIDRWGPKVFDTKADYLRCRARHLRNYYLHLLLWRLQGHGGILERHQDWLRRASASPTVLDYVNAIMEWTFLRTMSGLRQAAGRLGLRECRYRTE
jgi:glycosyltransferase involved in cell wall biosynthesis